VTRSLMRARCHRGAEIALKLGFSVATAEAIRALDEHWDGHGQPRGLRGAEIPLEARILCLAQTVEVFHAAGGTRAAYRVARKRSGEWFDPELVEALSSFRFDTRFWASLRYPDVSAVEPPDRVLTADEARLDQIAEGFAAVVDAKSPWTHEHCDRVCAIAIGMAQLLDFDETSLRRLRRAALLHDLGKLSISSRILDKPGPLSDEERARFREHPLLGEQILGQVSSFVELSAVASAHHERLDGSGYPPGIGRRCADHADARSGRGRRLRGADLRPPVPAGLPVAGSARSDARRRARTTGSPRVRGARDAVAQPHGHLKIAASGRVLSTAAAVAQPRRAVATEKSMLPSPRIEWASVEQTISTPALSASRT
jgi:putative nucleotidyltransferase with HDIG domain